MLGGTVPRFSFALENLKNIQEMIKFADQKAGAVLVVYGFLITIYLEIGKNLSFELHNNTNSGICTFVIGVISGFLILYEVICLFQNVVKPRLANDYKPEERCIYYFDHIARCSRSELVESIQNIEESNMVSEIATQLHENAKILTRKLTAIKTAINRLVASGILVAAFGVAAKMLEVVKW